MLRTRIEAGELGQLAGAGGRLEIHLGVDDLGRLADFAVDNDDAGEGPKTIDVNADFDQGPEGYPRMRLAIKGTLQLRCQRCLQAVPFVIDLTTRLTIVGEDEQTELLAEPFDSVVMEAGALNVATVVEDEILATLPMAPVHEGEEACTETVAHQQMNLENGTEQTYRPFESLATMVAGDKEGGAERSSDRRDK